MRLKFAFQVHLVKIALFVYPDAGNFICSVFEYRDVLIRLIKKWIFSAPSPIVNNDLKECLTSMRPKIRISYSLYE